MMSSHFLFKFRACNIGLIKSFLRFIFVSFLIFLTITSCKDSSSKGNKLIPSLTLLEKNYKYYTYVVNNSSNNITGYSINAADGALTKINSWTTGTGPRSVMTTPDGKFIYVVNNTSNNVTGYSIDATSGVLTLIGTWDTGQGTSPYSIAIDPTGKFVHVANFASNDVIGYNINAADGALTKINSWTTETGPNSVAVDPTGKFIYVTNYGSNNITGYNINTADGALTKINSWDTGTTGTTVAWPCSVRVDPTGKFVYVTNLLLNNVIGYSIDAANGALTKINSWDTTTGTTMAWPCSVTIDPTGRFIYIVNMQLNNVIGYSINTTSGALTKINSWTTGTNPFSVRVDPTGKFVYVANNSSNNVSGYSINAATGDLTQISGSPWPAESNPYSMTIVKIEQP